MREVLIYEYGREDSFKVFINDVALSVQDVPGKMSQLTEERAGGAESVFHFDVQGSVAKSTHAGIPWLRFIRQQLGGRVHFWPFDGWEVPPGRSVVAEVYMSPVAFEEQTLTTIALDDSSSRWLETCP